MKRLIAVLLLCAASAAADTLLVLNKRDATLAFVDPASMKGIAKIPTGEGPHEVAVSDDGKIYTANPGSNSMSVIDLTNAPRMTALKHIAVVKGPEGFDLGGGELWVAGRTAEGGISVIDAATDTVKQTIATKTKMANRVKFTRDGRNVVVSDPQSNVVLVFDATSKELVRTIPTAAFPTGLLFTPDGKRLFVGRSNAPKAQVFDTASWQPRSMTASPPR